MSRPPSALLAMRRGELPSGAESGKTGIEFIATAAASRRWKIF